MLLSSKYCEVFVIEMIIEVKPVRRTSAFEIGVLSWMY